MPGDSRKELLQSTSTITPPIRHLNSVNSQIMLIKSIQPPILQSERDINFNNPAFQSPMVKMRGSPIKNPNFNPITNINPPPHSIPLNQRYAFNELGKECLPLLKPDDKLFNIYSYPTIHQPK